MFFVYVLSFDANFHIGAIGRLLNLERYYYDKYVRSVLDISAQNN